MTKTIFLMNIGDFAPEVTRLTYPFIRYYADRIGAEIVPITERKFPDWPVTYEKMQIHALARSDWNIYIDSDALLFPDCPDYTLYLDKGTIALHGADVSNIRFRPDIYMRRDGRFLAPGNWFAVVSDLCADYWRPLEVSPAEAVGRITPTVDEVLHGITAAHLVDDYATCSNIARFGLKVKTTTQIDKEAGFNDCFLHVYTDTAQVKAVKLLNGMDKWGILPMLNRLQTADERERTRQFVESQKEKS